MKNVGVWLDKEKAHIVTIGDNGEVFETLESNIENFHIGGGSGTKFKGGPQDVVQDSKYLEREKHQTRAYFKELTNYLKDADSIVIFGPAEMNMKFKKELELSYKHINEKVNDVKKADSMTNNQVAELIRDYFNNWLIQNA